jgi:uncharacterized membrane protein
VYLVIVALYVAANATRYAWDAYPYILLNLLLGIITSLQAPIIMMSQNRQAERERAKADADLAVDMRCESMLLDLHTVVEPEDNLPHNTG